MRKGHLILAAAVLLGGAGVARSNAPSEIAVIVHAENPGTQMSPEDVRGHYMKQKSSWPNGEKIRPVDLESDGASRQTFLSQVLRTSAQDLERHWLEIKYRAAENPPKRVSDDEAIIKYVSAFKGAIGFVDVASLDKAKDKPVKVVLRVKGK